MYTRRDWDFVSAFIYLLWVLFYVIYSLTYHQSWVLPKRFRGDHLSKAILLFD